MKIKNKYATNTSTRGILVLILIAIATLWTTKAEATNQEPEQEENEQELDDGNELDLLFQLVADKASYEANAGMYDGVLVLSGVANTTVAFTERPIRLATEVPTALFVETAFTP